MPILPPATIGILGSGQLGRMLALCARQMGYRVHVFSPGTDTPTGQVADVEITASYLDLEAVREFAKNVDVVTYEFENVPLATAMTVNELKPLHPNTVALSTAQNRLREKRFISELGLPFPPFGEVYSLEALKTAAAEIGLPAVLKTAESGYDGKGQVKIYDTNELEAAWQKINEKPAVLEKFITFEKEISVVGARDAQGQFGYYGPIENEHVNHILDISTTPIEIQAETAELARNCVQKIMEAFDTIGVLCVEFFVTTNGELVVNEIAPRPHNSGHLTIEAHHTSQFEQQLRTICGLPLGNTAQIAPAAMANILGDLWPGPASQPPEPDWAAVCSDPNINLHLYGKADARIGRKMGHLTVLAESTAEARQTALNARINANKT